MEYQQQTLSWGSVCPQHGPQDIPSWGDPQIPQHQVHHGVIYSLHRYLHVFYLVNFLAWFYNVTEFLLISLSLSPSLSERHFQRMNRLLQQAMFLEFTWSCMRRVTDNTRYVNIAWPIKHLKDEPVFWWCLR